MGKRKQSTNKYNEGKRGRREQQQTADSATKPLMKQLPNVVELNVGGKKITTLLRTLKKEPGSKLAAMFSGDNEIDRDKDGRYFIDFDGEVFEHVLNFLRLKTMPPEDMVISVYSLAKSLNIASLANKLEQKALKLKHESRISL